MIIFLQKPWGSWIAYVVSLVGLMLLGSLGYAASSGSNDVKFGILAPIQAIQSNVVVTSTFPVLFVVDFAKQFEVQAGFGNIGQGEKQDSFNRFMIQGSWYGFKNESLKFGPMVGFYTFANGQKAGDNTMNSFYFGLSAKKNIWENIDIKLDVVGFGLTSGKSGGNDVKEANAFMPGVVFGFVFNLI